MGFRFRRSIRVAPGVRININKKSTSVTVGGKGFHHTVNSKGRRTTTVGLPGTGLSYQHVSSSSTRRSAISGSTAFRNLAVVIAVVIGIVVLAALLG
jgi:hypothetical protein